MLDRYYQDLQKQIYPHKVLVLYGPRRAGKTTLIRSYVKKHSKPVLFVTGDDINIRRILSSSRIDNIRDWVGQYRLVIIDEAQKIPHIGEGAKIISDYIPEVQLILTGSSSFELAGQVGEPLTGRKHTITLYPFAFLEIGTDLTPYERDALLPDILVYGSYPEVFSQKSYGKRHEALREITSSYMLKDILELDKVKNPLILEDLLRLLAYQVGNEVSLTALAQKLAIDYKTVARYLDLLEKTFVIKKIRGLRKNLAKEITQKHKYYFFDLGIRNMLIANLNKLEIRDDVGQLWENFIVMERIKKCSYHTILTNPYFWRTWEGQEIDYVEERNGSYHAYECKWSADRRVNAPSVWTHTYPSSTFEVITPRNYQRFIT